MNTPSFSHWLRTLAARRPLFPISSDSKLFRISDFGFRISPPLPIRWGEGRGEGRSALPIGVYLCLFVVVAVNALAISPEDLQRQLKNSAPVTFVDIRSATLFKQGHIPNAINVPAPLVPEKQLPPLGRVIVYDEGLGRDSVSAAAAALNQKPGITAEILDGGLAAWEQLQSPTTHTAGLKPEELPLITYDHLKKTPAADLVLVDLRKAKATPGKSAAQPLTDLSAEFPNAPITHSPFALPPTRSSLSVSPTLPLPVSSSVGVRGSASTLQRFNASTSSAAPPPLMVLIDNGDGTAQETARTLKANGIKRFVILAGGEETLARKGQPGLQRIGSSMTFHRQSSSSLTNTNR